MSSSSSSSTRSADDFFTRFGLSQDARLKCHEFAQSRFASSAISPVEFQGYCSYTLSVGPDTIVQFRPAVHRLDVDLARSARRVYGKLAPSTEFLGVVAGSLSKDVPKPRDGTTATSGLNVYSLSRIPGISLTDFRCSMSPHKRSQREDIVKEFARLFARGWMNAKDASDPELRKLKGRVGNSLRWRLEIMRAQLPQRFRPTVSKILRNLHRIEGLPWVLTHGDLVPANIMIELSPSDSEESGSGLRLSGLLDWAEAEYLPFGTGIYGLEELLGEESFQKRGAASGHRYPSRGSMFRYYPEAKDLRQAFWKELSLAIPDLTANKRTREAVKLAAVLGILLWHGIAFDDGKLDRVVESGRDDEEMGRLQVFLLGRADEDHFVPDAVLRQPSWPSTPLVVLGKAWFLIHSALQSLRIKLRRIWCP